MAKVLVFPMSKSDGCVRRLVQTLAPLTEDGRRELWNRRVNVTLRRLEANGIEKADAASEVQELLRQVKTRLRRRERDQERALEKRAERLRLVEADQLDLFAPGSAPLPLATTAHREEAGDVA